MHDNGEKEENAAFSLSFSRASVEPFFSLLALSKWFCTQARTTEMYVVFTRAHPFQFDSNLALTLISERARTCFFRRPTVCFSLVGHVLPFFFQSVICLMERVRRKHNFSVSCQIKQKRKKKENDSMHTFFVSHSNVTESREALERSGFTSTPVPFDLVLVDAIDRQTDVSKLICVHGHRASAGWKENTRSIREKS